MPTTVYISRRFVKKMLIIGISEVCRKRLCFPEEEFIVRLAGDMKVKVLNPFQDSGENESVTLMKKWIRKIFELAEKGWIQKVAIIISASVNLNQLKYQLKFLLKENAAEPMEIYSFSLMEKEICRKVDEHEIIDLTVEEDTKLKADAEDLLQGLKTKIFPARDLPDDFHFSLVKTSSF